MRRTLTQSCVLLGLYILVRPAHASPEELTVTSDSINYKLPDGETPRDEFTRAYSCYVFDALSGVHDPKCTESLVGSIETTNLSDPILKSFSDVTLDASADIDLNVIRHWWNAWTYQIRDLHGKRSLIPDRLNEFHRLTHYKSWRRVVVARSHVKDRTRVIYRSSINSRGISVSETLNSKSGDLNAQVLETEVVVERADGSGNHDFYVYSLDGALVNTAMFPAGERPAPSTCMSCHYIKSSGKFSRVGR